MALQPYIVEIRRDSEKHNKVLEFIMARVRLARERRTDRVTAWQQSEDLFTAYVKETEVDSRRRSVRDSGVPQFTTITIPYSYATLMTAHTYWTSVFLSRDPIHQIQGTSGESQEQEMSVEALLQHYVINGHNLVPYFIWLLDQGKYGEGIIGMTWDVKKHYIPEVRVGPKTFAGIPIPNTEKRYWSSREVIGYEGISLYNVRPYDFLFDPSVTLQNFQAGEFAGHDSFISLNRLKDQAALGVFFNVELVKGKRQSSRDTYQTSGGSQVLPRDTSPHGADDAALGCDLTEITIELIPRDLGLAPRDYLEKWSFTIANDDTIVSAQPQGWYHNEFMYATLEHEIEGYNVSKRGMMEMLRPLNITLDWLFNTHFYNVRKTLNNEFIYDPSILTSKDVEAPGPGKLIRVRPNAYGKDITRSFYQLQTADVTQQHVRDAMTIIEMMQRLTGVNDTVMGMLNNGRKTATEVRQSSSFAVNRLKTQCEYYSAMGWAPLTCRMIKTAQQMLSGQPARAYRAVGNQAERMERFIQVGPEQIAGSYDFIPVDGTMPIDRQAQAMTFTNMMMQMAKIPPVAQQYDWVRLFGYAAELHGVRNLQRFRINVVPDGTAAAGASAGNLVPASQAMPDMTNNEAAIPADGMVQR